MFVSYGKSDVVAPISAPMLQIVPLPVAVIVSAPGPKYSMIAPVPPLTVSTSATRRITSLGALQPDSRRVHTKEQEANRDRVREREQIVPFGNEDAFLVEHRLINRRKAIAREEMRMGVVPASHGLEMRP